MTIFGEILITKELHFDEIISGKGDLWCLSVHEQREAFFFPLKEVQAVAKRHNLKQVSTLNRKLNNRKIVITYDGFCLIHFFSLKADYRGPNIPITGIQRETLNGNSFTERRWEAFRKTATGRKVLPEVRELVGLLGDIAQW